MKTLLYTYINVYKQLNETELQGYSKQLPERQLGFEQIDEDLKKAQAVLRPTKGIAFRLRVILHPEVRQEAQNIGQRIDASSKWLEIVIKLTVYVVRQLFSVLITLVDLA